MNRRTSRFALVAAIAVTLLAGSGQAATFAQFQMAPADNLFFFERLSPSGATLTATDVPILFNYSNVDNLPVGVQGPVSASVTVMMQTASNATQSGLINTQPFDGFVNSISIDLDAPVAGGTNLLTAIFNGGALFGPQDGVIAMFGSSQPTNDVQFSSDFLIFSGQTGNGLSLAFTSLDPGLAYENDTTPLKNFSAAATGSFSTEAAIEAVPEPATVLFVGLGLIVIGLVRRQRHA